MLNINDLKKHAKNIRKSIVNVGFNSPTTHFGGALSCIDILAYIYSNFIQKNNTKKNRFILSKGHCAIALYATLYEFGFISKEDLLSFNSNGGEFPSHCVKKTEKGIELSSGSLGMGLSFAIGQAIALKRKNINNKIFVLTGNGEANEGEFWEAVMFAGHKNIDNLILILDNNNLQNDGRSKDVLDITKWKEKFEAFNWNTVEIDGNNMEEIVNAFENNKKYPLVIISNTIKGKGISFMENVPKWHHNSLTEEEYNQAMKELEV